MLSTAALRARSDMERLIIVCEKRRELDIAELAQAAGFEVAEVWGEESLQNREPPAGCVFCIAVKDKIRRAQIAEFLRKKNAKFASLIHPSCEISKFADIGEGAVIEPFCMVSANAVLGEFCLVESHSLIGHNASVGKCSNIGSHCDITGFCQIGEFCEIRHGAAIIPNVKIGNNVIVGENSAVIKSAKDFEKICGIPARKIGAVE